MRHLVLGFFFLACWVGCIAPSRAQVRPALRKLARDIAADVTVDTESVGRGRIKTDQYRRYEQLRALATDAELLTLTDHRSPAVRCYAYQCLCERNYPALLIPLRKHEFDTAMVTVQVNCFGLYMPVIISMKQDFELQQQAKQQLLAPTDTLLFYRIDRAETKRSHAARARRKQHAKR